MYTGGLKRDLKALVIAQHSATIDDAMTIAEEQEGVIDVLKDKGTHRSLSKPTLNAAPVSMIKPKQDASLLPRKYLSREEMNTRQQAGLCYNCDEERVKGHRCKAPTLYLMEEETELENINDPSSITTDAEEAQISIHALTGSVSTSTLKFTGQFGNHSFIDTGSSHSFIDENTAHKI